MTQKLTVARPFHVCRGKYGRKDLCQGEAAPTPPAGRVPRVARLMALAIRFDGLMRQGL